MVSETQIYLNLRKYLPERGWVLVGGDPPDGTNSIPRIELKEETHTAKGSKGSKKIDLLFFKQGYFLLLELKGKYNISDVKKLNEIVDTEKWRKAFILALKEKRALELKNIKINEQEYILSGKKLIRAIAYSEGKSNHAEFVTFVINDGEVKLNFGDDVNQEIRQLF